MIAKASQRNSEYVYHPVLLIFSFKIFTLSSSLFNFWSLTPDPDLHLLYVKRLRNPAIDYNFHRCDLTVLRERRKYYLEPVLST